MNRIESLEKVYELTFVSFIEMGAKIKQIIEKAGGVVLLEKELQKIRLAYPVKKQQYGFLGIVEFKAKSDLIDSILKTLKSEIDVVRHLVCGMELKSDSDRKRGERHSRDNRERIGMSSRVVKKPVDASLTNEAIEKKIEEILK